MLETTLPPTQRMELLQRAYVHAVVAHAGASAFRPEPDNGADLGISPVKLMPNGKYCNTGHQLYCQLKATTVFEIKDGEVVYDMEADAFNKLAHWEGASPIILVLFCMPKASEEWLESSISELTLRHCCYWWHVRESPTDNSSKIRIRIPTRNVFDTEGVCRLITTMRQQSGSISYDF